MEKDNIQNLLINVGRKIVREKGTEALTVRKLSEASGCSVGAIYNQFSNMENFIVVQNYMTLDDLFKRLEKVKETENAYADMNALLQTFVDYVIENKNLWYLLYIFHLRHHRVYSLFYMKKIVTIVGLIHKTLQKIVPNMERPERIVSSQVLWLTLFALSSFLSKNILDSLVKINKENICQILMNIYISGLTVLEDNNESINFNH